MTLRAPKQTFRACEGRGVSTYWLHISLVSIANSVGPKLKRRGGEGGREREKISKGKGMGERRVRKK
jgi:hypothetical protein